MRKRSRSHQLSLCLGGIALAAFARQGQAQLAVTGNTSTTPVSYGPNVPGTGALATQTINTGFGDNTVGDGTSGGGSELDAAYGVVQNGNLYLFLSGNFENNGNHVDVFIADGASGGQNVLNISNGWTAAGMNGSVFSPNFNANLMLDANDYAGTLYVDKYVLNATGSTNTYLGQIGLSGGVGNGTLGGMTFGLNNTNAAGVNGNAGTAADSTAAQAVSTGLEIGIPLSALGNPTGNIEVLADINGGGDGYLSNQFLPGLPVGTGDVGGGGTYAGPTGGAFNLSSLPNFWFSVAVPANLPNGTWINPGSGNWGTSTNWANGVIPQSAGDSASFSVASAPSTVTLNTGWSVGNLSFSSSFSYDLAPGTAGVLTMDNGSGTASVTDFSGTHTISAPVVLNSNTTVEVVNNGDGVTISGNISGVGGLTVNNPGAGVVLLSGTNTYGGGTTVLAGNLQLGSSSALPTGTALTLNAQDVPSGALDLNGNDATVSSITVLTGPNTGKPGFVAQIINTSATPGTATFTYAGSNGNPSTFSGYIYDNSGGGGGTTALTVASGSLTLAPLTGNNNYAGATTINSGGHLIAAYNFGGEMVGITNALPASGNVVNNGTLEISNAYVTTPATVLAATLGTVSGSGTTTVDANMAVDVGSFSQAGLVNNGATEIDGNGTVGTSSGGGAITGGGALTIGNGSTSNTLQLAQNSGDSSQGSVTVNAGSSLDIYNNTVFINFAANGFGDPFSTIAGYIKSGYNGGNWNGPGIISTAAQTKTNGLSYGIGYADGVDGIVSGLSSGQVEVKYTLLGDANLDGLVNAADFTILAANFNQPVTGWDQGDFNYDGLVNAADFTDLAANFNQNASGADVSAGDVAALDAFAAANGISLANVPEPAGAALMLMTGLGILRRRRRRN
ncbi:MAG: dockerin type I repeat-containing protein [Tepidisphaeraceae bacterium]|jgi:autotransporter-associated beta strand protein